MFWKVQYPGSVLDEHAHHMGLFQQDNTTFCDRTILPLFERFDILDLYDLSNTISHQNCMII